jgi:hypothetical protein
MSMNASDFRLGQSLHIPPLGPEPLGPELVAEGLVTAVIF